MSFFFSLSLALSLCFFRLIPWSTEALWVHFFARASKTQSRRHSASSLQREGALHLHSIKRAPVASVNRASPVSGALLAFCVNQGISVSFSLLYFLSRRCRSSWGYPWILLGLDPGTKSLQSCPTVCNPIDNSHQAPPSLGFWHCIKKKTNPDPSKLKYVWNGPWPTGRASAKRTGMRGSLWGWLSEAQLSVFWLLACLHAGLWDQAVDQVLIYHLNPPCFFRPETSQSWWRV